MTTPQEPPQVSLSYYLVMVPNYWGKGITPTLARANLREAGGESAQADPENLIWLRVHPTSPREQASPCTR